MTVQSNINSHEPVILSGSPNSNGSDGHEWVCDGYMENTVTWCNDDGSFGGGETFLLFDMNWGWNEATVPGTTPWPNVDGWYGFANWQVYNGNTLEYYHYYLDMTYNIHP